jgi:hypothetical protein
MITEIRRAVATLANQINKKIKNLSRAFKKAWATIKGETIQSKIAGVSFNDAQQVLERLTTVEAGKVTVGLVREADNEFDANAIAVTINVNKNKLPHKIGYLPRELAAYMAKLIDKGLKLTAAFKGVTGGTRLSGRQVEGYFWGALIEIKLI